MSRVAAIHVVSEIAGLANQVRKLLPCVKVIDIDVKTVTETEETDGKKLPELLKNAEIILADPLVITKALYNAPNLKWAHCTWAGVACVFVHTLLVNNYRIERYVHPINLNRQAGVDSIFKTLDSSKPLPEFILTRSGQGFGTVMAEYVVGQIIANERYFYAIKEDQKEKKWKHQERLVYRALSELSIGILGVGQIGSEVAKMCKSFGMTVWGLVQSKPETRYATCSYVDQFCSIDGLSRLLSNCDYVCNILPSTPSTRGLLNGNFLEACKEKKAIFINVGRGDIIEEKFLINALKSDWLGGAIVDVFSKEPLAEESELWSLPNVTITPHVSAVSFSENTGALFKSNYDCFTEGNDLHYKVNWDKAY